MKKSFSLIFICIAFSVHIFAQCDNPGLTINSLFFYTASVNGDKVDVTFSINSASQQFSGTLCKEEFYWDFGDGETKPVTITSLGENTDIVHSYSMSNKSVYSNGILNAIVTLNVSVSEIVDSQCEETDCYKWATPISHNVGTPSLMTSFFTKPSYVSYPIKQKINFYFNVQALGLNNLDGITYSVENVDDHSGSNGSLSSSDLYDDKLVYNFTPSAVGDYYFKFKLERYGAILYSKELPIKVKDDGPPPSSGGANKSCTCSNLVPDFNVTYSQLGRYLYFSFDDISSKEFKDAYAGCAKYWLSVQTPDKPGSVNIVGEFNVGALYEGRLYDRFAHDIIPDVLDNPVTYTFYWVVTCMKNGERYTNQATKYVIIKPKQFDAALENTKEVAGTGGVVDIDPHTTSCFAIECNNLNNKTDKMEWLTKLQLHYYPNLIHFDVGPNYDEFDRNLEVRMYVNGNYDKCLSEIDGKKQVYRSIKVHQPTLLTKLNDKSPLVALPPFVFENTSETRYYDTDVRYVDSRTQSIHTKQAGSINLETLLYKEPFKVELYRMGSDGKAIGSGKEFSIKADGCGQGFNKTTARSYDLYVSLNKTDLAIADFAEDKGRSMAIYAENSITFKSGFSVPNGAHLTAQTLPCNTSLSLKSATVQNQVKDSSDIKKAVQLVDLTNTVKVYPNPNDGFFNVDLTECLNPIDNIAVYSITGQLIVAKSKINQQVVEIDMRNKPAGLYTVKVIDNKSNLFVTKIIKN